MPEEKEPATDSYHDIAILQLPEKDEEGDELLPKLEKYLANNGSAAKIAPDKVSDYKKLFKHKWLGIQGAVDTKMVDIYNTAEVNLVSNDFIEQYSAEPWNLFKGVNAHKGLVSVAGWA